jgi:prepilin signal peptidase PulO-like enzyme (type II secretory pathway)
MWILTILMALLFPVIAVLIIRREEETGIKAKLQPFDRWNLLTYLLVPALIITLYFWQVGKLSFFTIFQYDLLLFFGYITAIQDYRTKRIPNAYIVMMFTAWFVTIFPQIFLHTDTIFTIAKDAGLGFLFGGGLFLLVYVISRKGLGGGDVKFMAASGLYLGFDGIFSAMLFGATLAALVGLVLILLKRVGRKDTMPLVPFLYIGILLTIFFS